MQNMTDKLEMLKPEEWGRVRDITIPLIRNENAGTVSNEGDIHNAICFTGEPNAKRLYDPSEPESLQRLISIFCKVDGWLSLGHRKFKIDEGGLAFRAQVGRHATGEDLQLRVLPEDVPTLHQLHLPDVWRALMMDPDLLNGGLILITATNGQGKTTTSSAIVRSRLEMYGGFANTVEDPIELPLQGVWGKGVCMQRPVDQFESDGLPPGEGYFRALTDTLRQFPAISGGGTILFCGEIRDAQTAAETLKAAINGHLVIATIHAKSEASACRRMATLAAGAKDSADIETVRDLLAEAMRAVFYQRLSWSRDEERTGWDRGQVGGGLLWSDGPGSKVAQAIREGKFDALHAFAKAQNQAMNALIGSKPSVGQIRKELKNHGA